MPVTEIKYLTCFRYRGIHYHRGYDYWFRMMGAIYGSETTMIFKKKH